MGQDNAAACAEAEAALGWLRVTREHHMGLLCASSYPSSLLGVWSGKGGQAAGVVWPTCSFQHRCDGDIATVGPWERAAVGPLGSPFPLLSEYVWGHTGSTWHVCGEGRTIWLALAALPSFHSSFSGRC